MIAKLQALGDRMLDLLLPGATAEAASCIPSEFITRVGSCNYYCHMTSTAHCAQLRKCDGEACKIISYDTCC